MGKSSTISTASKPEDIDKGFTSAVKAMSMLGIKMAAKKPDAKKLGAITKDKPATFQLVEDGKKLKLVVASSNATNTLGIFDTQAEKDLKKQVALYKSLIASGFNYKAELAEAEKALKGGPDTKVLANIERELAAAQKYVDAAKKRIAEVEKIGKFETVVKNPDAAKGVAAWAKKTANDDTWNCLLDIARKVADKAIIDRYIRNGAPDEMNIDDTLRNAIVAGTKPVKAVYPILDTLFAQNVTSKWKIAEIQTLKTAAAPYAKKIVDLTALKKKELKG